MNWLMPICPLTWTEKIHRSPRSTWISEIFLPMLIQVGSDETLLDDAARLAARAGAADVAVTLQIWPHMIHAWPLWNAHLEDGRRALANAGAFIRAHL